MLRSDAALASARRAMVLLVLGVLASVIALVVIAAPADASPAAGGARSAVLAGTPNGTSATAAGCAPYYPFFAYGDGFICLPAIVQGVRVDDPGICVGQGFAARPFGGNGFTWQCIDQGNIVTGDLAAPASEGPLGSALCAAQGLTVSTVGNWRVCSGTDRALAVRDAAAGTKLDTLAGKVDAVQAATVANKPAAAGSAAAASTVSVTDGQWFPLFWTVLGGLCLVLLFVGVSTAKTLFGR